MQSVLIKVKPIIVYIIITFLSVSILGVLFSLIQGFLISILIYFIILTFWFNPIFVIAEYFFVKKIIENCSKQEYTDIEWMLIKLNIISAELAGVAAAHLLALCVNKDFFMITFGGYGLRSVDIGMAIPLVIMLFVTGIKEIYQLIKMLSADKKEKRDTVTEDKGATQILTVLIVVMVVLTFTGFLLGKKLEQYPSLEELVQNKAEYILKHKDYIEAIREYIKDLDYEEIVTCGEWKQEIGNLEAFFDMENEGYGILRLSADGFLKDVDLKDINIIATYGDIVVEFDTQNYEVKKIYIPVRYEQEGRRTLSGGSLVWYSSDYVDRESGFILDDNWLIRWLEQW